MFLILLYSTLKSTVVQYSGWQRGAGTEWTDKKSYWLGEEVGDGTARGSSTMGGGWQAVISLMLYVDGTGSDFFLDSLLSILLLPDILGLK